MAICGNNPLGISHILSFPQSGRSFFSPDSFPWSGFLMLPKLFVLLTFSLQSLFYFFKAILVLNLNYFEKNINLWIVTIAIFDYHKLQLSASQHTECEEVGREVQYFLQQHLARPISRFQDFWIKYLQKFKPRLVDSHHVENWLAEVSVAVLKFESVVEAAWLVVVIVEVKQIFSG